MNKITESIRLAAKNQNALSMKEEARLNTLSHCMTMGLFRSYDLCRLSRTMAGRGEQTFLRTWGRQCLTKIVDDELFGANVDTLTQIANNRLDIADPIGNPYYKAVLGVLARLMTLTVMVPFQNVTDPAKRKAIIKESPRVPLYNGFTRQALKECTFTAAYVLSSAYVGDYLSARKLYLRERWSRCLARWPQSKTECRTNDSAPRSCDNKECGNCVGSMLSMLMSPFYGDKKAVCDVEISESSKHANGHEKCDCAATATELTINAGKASIAGVVSTLMVSPIENYGKMKPGATKATLFKAGRKGCYNAINSIMAKTLQKQAVHRVAAKTLSVRYLGETDAILTDRRS